MADLDFAIDLGPLTRGLAETAKQTREAAAGALFEEASSIMGDSQANYVPIDTGVLRASGHVQRPVVDGDEITVTLGYGGPAEAYALIQHERTEFHHTVTAPAPSVAGAGIEEIPGSGGVTAPAPSVSGEGDVHVPVVVTQHGLEVARVLQAPVRITLHGIEVARSVPAPVRITLHGLEVASRYVPQEASFVDGGVSCPITWIELIDKLGRGRSYAEVDLNDPADYHNGYKASLRRKERIP